jgi:hypothetical protein
LTASKYGTPLGPDQPRATDSWPKHHSAPSQSKLFLKLECTDRVLMLQRRDETYVCIRVINDKKRFEKRFEKLFRKIRQEDLEARKEGFYKDGQKD